jgi:predicted nucleic acid-binding protein
MQDLWIASLAIQHGHKILTLNARDFEDIPGIELLTLP